ncbi:hypothetical protein L7F22_015639 [Adiantum nelumboides]|nr:hypothetical protein [Adiantum nelumboides]
MSCLCPSTVCVRIVADSRENLIISDLKGLMDVYMLRYMFTNWKKVPYEDKQVIHGILHERFPNNIVREDVLFSHMGKILRSKRSEIEKAIKGNYKKPSWCSKQLWDQAKERHRSNVGKWFQQREARRVQLQHSGHSQARTWRESAFQSTLCKVNDPKLAKVFTIIYNLMQVDYTYNESIDVVTDMVS